jgi:hypothetical protein
LVALLDRQLATHLWAQLAKVAAVLIAVGYVLLMIAVAFSGAARQADVLVKNALFWLSWIVAGSVALGAAGPADSEADRAVGALASQRGYSARSLTRARALAVLRRIFRLVAIPAAGLAVLALAVAASASLLLPRVLLVFGVLGYAALLAGVLTALVELSRWLSPQRARGMLVLLVLGPHVLRSFSPHVPSVPALFSSVLDGLLKLGGLS